MAAPNLLATSTVTGKTALASLSTVTANVITNSSASGTVAKLENILLSNYTANTVTANVMINRSSTVYYVGGTISVPANSTLVLLAKDTSLYLEEGDVLQCSASANTAVSLSAGYELIS